MKLKKRLRNLLENTLYILIWIEMLGLMVLSQMLGLCILILQLALPLSITLNKVR